jgi:hypothetical protein
MKGKKREIRKNLRPFQFIRFTRIMRREEMITLHPLG